MYVFKAKLRVVCKEFFIFRYIYNHRFYRNKSDDYLLFMYIKNEY